MKRELRMERMNLFDRKGEYSETLFSDAGAKSSETLFRGNDKTFDETPKQRISDQYFTA